MWLYFHLNFIPIYYNYIHNYAIVFINCQFGQVFTKYKYNNTNRTLNNLLLLLQEILGYSHHPLKKI